MITASVHEEGAFSGLEELAETEISLGDSSEFEEFVREEEERYHGVSEEVDCAGLSIESDCFHPRPA